MICSIVKVDSDSSVHLAGRAWSQVATRIRYCFVVAQSGEAGETKLAELGELDLPADQPIDFGHTKLAIQADCVYDAHLVVSWESGEMECGLAAAA